MTPAELLSRIGAQESELRRRPYGIYHVTDPAEVTLVHAGHLAGRPVQSTIGLDGGLLSGHAFVVLL